MPKKQVKTSLTRAEMEEIIQGGGSIHHEGQIISDIAGLPDDVDLAESEEDLEAAEKQLEADEAALAAKKEKLANTKAGKGKAAGKTAKNK